MNAARNHQPDEEWENTPPPIESTAAQGHPRDLRYVNMGYYDMANDHPPPHEGRNPATNFSGIALDTPTQAQAQFALPAPVCADLIFLHKHNLLDHSLEEVDILDGPDGNAAPGPARAFPDEWPPQGPVPNGLANEVLRQLAVLYLREPNSQVAEIHMEPGHAHGVRVVITLELTNL